MYNTHNTLKEKGAVQMSRTVVIANQKGGVGKTTTATSLTAGLKLKGFNTLLVDTDPQANASDTFNISIDDKPTIYDIFRGTASVDQTIQTTVQGDIIPGDLQMSAADIQFTKVGREHILRKALSSIKNRYDFIVIDTPPALGIITICALTAADSLIIPMIADRYSLQGIRQLSETIETIREYSNPDLKIDGILLTRYNARTVLSRDIRKTIDEISGTWGTRLFSSTIRQGVSLQESQTQQESIFSYAPDSTTGQDYAAFIDEYIGGLDK